MNSSGAMGFDLDTYDSYNLCGKILYSKISV